MTPSLPRVLHVIPSLAPIHGGTTSAVLQMIAGLERLGVACEVAVSDDDGPRQRLAGDAPERDLHSRHYFPKVSDFYTYTPSLARWLQTNVCDYDLVHIHGLFNHVAGLAGRICRRHSVPYVVTPHGMANRYGMGHKRMLKTVSFGLIERALLEGATAVHMTSRGEERDFVDLGIGTPVVRIPLAVTPVAHGDGAALRTRYPEIGCRQIAIFMGRLNPIKNLEAAIDALALPSGADFHLVVCGEGPDDYLHALKLRAAARGVAERITWLGFVAGQAKADVFAAGDVYVQPSLSESFGIAAIEAVSAGLPCVLGENVAVAEELTEPGLAIAVPPTSKAIADGIRMALLFARQTPDYAARARAFVTSNFASGSVDAELVKLYQNALACSSRQWE